MQQQQRQQQGFRVPLDPRSARDVAEDGRGLARAIGKTLGVLSQQVGEWEAVEAEEAVMQEEVGLGDGEEGGQGFGDGDGGLPAGFRGGGARDYYFDDEAEEGFEEEEVVGCGSLL